MGKKICIIGERSREMFIGDDNPLTIIAGPCVLDGSKVAYDIAEELKSITSRLEMNFIFKASFDKANRTSVHSFRRPGLEQGLSLLQDIKQRFDIAVTTDVHEPHQVEAVADVVDLIQIPAFLTRQTDLLTAVGDTGLPVNIKKMQMMAPEDMEAAVNKIRYSNSDVPTYRRVLLTERGTFFGYHNLVVDFRGLSVMAQLGYPVIFDVTHSLQLPGSKGTESGGLRELIAPMARAAVAFGVDGVFLEVHSNPDEARCDGANSLALRDVSKLLYSLHEIQETLRS